MHLVMFDIDGTLTQSNAVDADCYAQAASDVLKLPSIDHNWSRYKRVTDSGIAAEIIETHFGREPINGELDSIHERLVELLEMAFAASPSSCLPIDGAVEMLSKLSDRGDVAVALATGGWGDSARLKCRTAGLMVEQYAFASADDFCSREEIVSIARTRAAERYGVSAFESVVYVGDGPWDFQASCALGIPFIGIASGESAERLKGIGAELLLPDYRDYSCFLEMIGLSCTSGRRSSLWNRLLI